MTLRDQLALAALSGIAARPFHGKKDVQAQEAYEYADAWLAERAKPQAQVERERAAYAEKQRKAGWS